MLKSGDLVRHVRTMDIRMVIDGYIDRRGRKHYVLCDGKRYRGFTLFKIKESELQEEKMKDKKIKQRNWIAVKAHLRSGAGAHKDKKKENSKRACRGKWRKHEQQQIWYTKVAH